jgi:hypothetical protein
VALTHRHVAVERLAERERAVDLQPSPGLSSAVRSTDSTRRNICSRRNPAVVAPEWNDRCRQQS